jgi:hypothetical protein
MTMIGDLDDSFRVDGAGRPFRSGRWFVAVVILFGGAGLSGCNDDRADPGTSRAPGGNATSRSTTPAPGPEFAIDIEAENDDPTRVVVSVTANSRNAWSALNVQDEQAVQAVLSFHLVTESPANQPQSAPSLPVLGQYSLKENTLQFRPAFPLVPGERYVARFDPRRLADRQSAAHRLRQREYVVPMSKTEPPRVLSVFPSGNIVPANHLKFYIRFSEPMQRDGIFQHFSLIDLKTEKPVPRPFRHVELWSKDNRQLTLWFHPGRQKRGVNLNVEVGPVLKPDGEYRLVIDGDWKSEKGRKLGTPFTKSIRAGQPDHRQPDPQTWIVSPPGANSRDSLRCEFHEPLDAALLHSELSVIDSSGKKVPGDVELGYGEMSWAFFPEQPWRPGDYRLAIGSLLEDLAGNSLERPFATDVTGHPLKAVGKTVYLTFNVAAPE